MLARVALSWILGAWLGATAAWGQVAGFQDDFAQDPSSGGWILQGAAAWVPPGSPVCVDPITGAPAPNAFDRNDPCSVYEQSVIEELVGFDRDPIEEFGGYVLVTPAALGQSGNIFRTQKTEYENFRLKVVVELRDGTVSSTADGMTVVIIGTDTPPGLGVGGGAMGATGLGAGPTMVFEFDNWSSNIDDFTDGNHVGFAFDPDGLDPVDWIPMDVFVPIDPSVAPLHNRQSTFALRRHADPNRFRMTAYVQNGRLACHLEALDRGIHLGRVYSYTIPDFEGFAGFLGVTATTSGVWQSHILHSVEVTQLPDEFCIDPPGSAERRISSKTSENCGDWADGDVLPVTIELMQVRRADENCGAPAQIVIKERVPPNWVALDISDGGAFASETGVITWTLTGPSLVAGKTVSYSVLAIDNGNAAERLEGKVQEADDPDAAAQGESIGGDSRLRVDTPFDPNCGGITCWNILGPYEQPPEQLGGIPGKDRIRADYLTDGRASETGFVFFPGAQIGTDFGLASRSTGFAVETRGRNVDGIATVVAWNDPDDSIDLNDEVYGGDPNYCMAYAQCYIHNRTGADLEVRFAVSSDDSVQVLLNGSEVWIRSTAREGSNSCAPQDISPDGITFLGPHILEPGENNLIVKTFAGEGAFDFSIAIQDMQGVPVQQGLDISKFPIGECPKPRIAAARILETGTTVEVQNEALASWELGETYTVQIELTDLLPERVGVPCPDAAEPVTIRERLPAGWTAGAVSEGGSVDGQVITWEIAGDPETGRVLSYDVTAPRTAADAHFLGSFRESGSQLDFPVGGSSRLANPPDFSRFGFWSKWILLGPYEVRAGFGWGAAPSPDNMRLDFLTDGEASELTIESRPGETILTDFNGAAASLGLAEGLGSARDRLPPGRVPTWTAWIDADHTVSFKDYYGGDLDRVLMYGVIYLLVQQDVTADIGLASDDSIQVLLDGEEIWLNSVVRRAEIPNEVLDVVAAKHTPGLNPLKSGIHRIMVKVFEGGGEHRFRLRLQDPVTGEPITEGVSLCFSPDASECDSTRIPREPLFVRGDVDASGLIDITDPVFLLRYLFSRGEMPPCLDAADVDNLTGHGITDAIFLLSWLFRNGRAPPPPSPMRPGYGRDACGIDPEGGLDGVTCEHFPPCP